MVVVSIYASVFTKISNTGERNEVGVFCTFMFMVVAMLFLSYTILWFIVNNRIRNIKKGKPFPHVFSSTTSNHARSTAGGGTSSGDSSIGGSSVASSTASSSNEMSSASVAPEP